MDRISGLSDELVVKILLLVPTKVAVSTSILSKRWEYLWMWLPKLEFRHRHGSDTDCERLLRFLDRNLPLHRAPIIESFRLELFYPRLKPEKINMCVVYAVSHCLRELEITYLSYPHKPVIFPSNLYTCKSLVILKLEGDILLDVPRMVSLPSLETLKLQYVRYFNEQTLQRLLSNSPILEELLVDLGERERYTTRKLSVVVPSLLSLSLVIPDDHEIDELVIDTPFLKYFKLVDHSSNDHYCLIENMPYLIEADVDVYLLDMKSIIGSITSVKRLEICSLVLSSTSLNIWIYVYAQSIPRIINLSGCSNLLPTWKLEGLNLFYMDDHESLKMDDWNQPTTVPECILSSLQSFSWSEYTGEPHEREIAVYILKHALHLKTATIKSSQWDVTELEMLKELSRSSRASTACQLMFE